MPKLTVHLIEAKDLPVADVIDGQSDPYVQLSIGSKTQKSTTKSNTLCPEWDEHFSFEVSDANEPLLLQVFDRDPLSKDDLLGTAELPLQYLPRGHTVTVRQALEGPNCTPTTTLCLQLCAEDFGVEKCLQVQVHEGSNLLPADDNGKSDPYLLLKVGGTSVQTTTKHATLAPCWEENFFCPVTSETKDTLHVLLYDYDEGAHHDELGKLQLKLASLPKNTSKDVKLKPVLKDKKTGKWEYPDPPTVLSMTLIAWNFGSDPPPPLPASPPPTSQENDTDTQQQEKTEATVEHSHNPVFTAPQAALAAGEKQLEVRLLKGQDLLPADDNGKSDPYVVFVITNINEKCVSTIKHETLNPTWNEQFLMNVDDESKDLLSILLYDSDGDTNQSGTVDDVLGKYQLKLNKLPREQTKAVSVKPMLKNRQTGKWEQPSPPTILDIELKAIGFGIVDTIQPSLSLDEQSHQQVATTDDDEEEPSTQSKTDTHAPLSNRDTPAADSQLSLDPELMKSDDTVQSSEAGGSKPGTPTKPGTAGGTGKRKKKKKGLKLSAGRPKDKGADSPSTGTSTKESPGMKHLSVHLLSAEKLIACDANGQSDPYVTIRVGGSHTLRSSTQHATVDPVWDQTFDLPVQDEQLDTLIIELYDEDDKDDDPMGKSQLKLAKLPRDTPKVVSVKPLLKTRSTGKWSLPDPPSVLHLKLTAHHFGIIQADVSDNDNDVISTPSPATITVVRKCKAQLDRTTTEATTSALKEELTMHVIHKSIHSEQVVATITMLYNDPPPPSFTTQKRVDRAEQLSQQISASMTTSLESNEAERKEDHEQNDTNPTQEPHNQLDVGPESKHEEHQEEPPAGRTKVVADREVPTAAVVVASALYSYAPHIPPKAVRASADRTQLSTQSLSASMAPKDDPQPRSIAADSQHITVTVVSVENTTAVGGEVMVGHHDNSASADIQLKLFVGHHHENGHSITCATTQQQNTDARWTGCLKLSVEDELEDPLVVEVHDNIGNGEPPSSPTSSTSADGTSVLGKTTFKLYKLPRDQSSRITGKVVVKNKDSNDWEVSVPPMLVTLEVTAHNFGLKQEEGTTMEQQQTEESANKPPPLTPCKVLQVLDRSDTTSHTTPHNPQEVEQSSTFTTHVECDRSTVVVYSLSADYTEIVIPTQLSASISRPFGVVATAELHKCVEEAREEGIPPPNVPSEEQIDQQQTQLDTELQEDGSTTNTCKTKLHVVHREMVTYTDSLDMVTVEDNESIVSQPAQSEDTQQVGNGGGSITCQVVDGSGLSMDYDSFVKVHLDNRLGDRTVEETYGTSSGPTPEWQEELQLSLPAPSNVPNGHIPLPLCRVSVHRSYDEYVLGIGDVDLSTIPRDQPTVVSVKCPPEGGLVNLVMTIEGFVPPPPPAAAVIDQPEPEGTTSPTIDNQPHSQPKATADEREDREEQTQELPETYTTSTCHPESLPRVAQWLGDVDFNEPVMSTSDDEQPCEKLQARDVSWEAGWDQISAFPPGACTQTNSHTFYIFQYNEEHSIAQVSCVIAPHDIVTQHQPTQEQEQEQYSKPSIHSGLVIPADWQLTVIKTWSEKPQRWTHHCLYTDFPTTTDSTLENNVYLLFYSSYTSDYHISRIDATTGDTDVLRVGLLSFPLTHIVPCYFTTPLDGPPHNNTSLNHSVHSVDSIGVPTSDSDKQKPSLLCNANCLLYDNMEGDFTVMSMSLLHSDGAEDQAVVTQGHWCTGWTHITPRTVGTSTKTAKYRFLCYSDSTGEMSFQTININSAVTTTIPPQKLLKVPKYDCMMVPMVFYGYVCCMLYKHFGPEDRHINAPPASTALHEKLTLALQELIQSHQTKFTSVVLLTSTPPCQSQQHPVSGAGGTTNMEDSNINVATTTTDNTVHKSNCNTTTSTHTSTTQPHNVDTIPASSPSCLHCLFSYDKATGLVYLLSPSKPIPQPTPLSRKQSKIPQPPDTIPPAGEKSFPHRRTSFVSAGEVEKLPDRSSASSPWGDPHPKPPPSPPHSRSGTEDEHTTALTEKKQGWRRRPKTPVIDATTLKKLWEEDDQQGGTRSGASPTTTTSGNKREGDTIYKDSDSDDSDDGLEDLRWIDQFRSNFTQYENELIDIMMKMQKNPAHRHKAEYISKAIETFMALRCPNVDLEVVRAQHENEKEDRKLHPENYQDTTPNNPIKYTPRPPTTLNTDPKPLPLFPIEGDRREWATLDPRFNQKEEPRNRHSREGKWVPVGPYIPTPDNRIQKRVDTILSNLNIKKFADEKSMEEKMKQLSVPPSVKGTPRNKWVEATLKADEQSRKKETNSKRTVYKLQPITEKLTQQEQEQQLRRLIDDDKEKRADIRKKTAAQHLAQTGGKVPKLSVEAQHDQNERVYYTKMQERREQLQQLHSKHADSIQCHNKTIGPSTLEKMKERLYGEGLAAMQELPKRLHEKYVKPTELQPTKMSPKELVDSSARLYTQKAYPPSKYHPH